MASPQHSSPALARAAEILARVGEELAFVEARSSVRERLRGEGLDVRLGGIDRFTSVADAVDSFQKARWCGEMTQKPVARLMQAVP